MVKRVDSLRVYNKVVAAKVPTNSTVSSGRFSPPAIVGKSKTPAIPSGQNSAEFNLQIDGAFSRYGLFWLPKDTVTSLDTLTRAVGKVFLETRSTGELQTYAIGKGLVEVPVTAETFNRVVAFSRTFTDVAITSESAGFFWTDQAVKLETSSAADVQSLAVGKDFSDSYSRADVVTLTYSKPVDDAVSRADQLMSIVVGKAFAETFSRAETFNLTVEKPVAETVTRVEMIQALYVSQSYFASDYVSGDYVSDGQTLITL